MNEVSGVETLVLILQLPVERRCDAVQNTAERDWKHQQLLAHSQVGLSSTSRWQRPPHPFTRVSLADVTPPAAPEL